MVQEYTPHTADYVSTNRAALESARLAADCNLLVTQLETGELDGLTIAGSLGEQFPRLHTFFLPAYPLDAQRLEIANTKVFPEPIDGERFLHAVDRVAASPDVPDLFHVIDLLQMFCLSGKTGGVQLVAGSETGVVYLREGELRHAERARSRGLEAINEMLRWGYVEFAYDAGARPKKKSIDLGWEAVLIEAVLRDREEQALQFDSRLDPEIAAVTLPAEPDLTGQQLGNYLVGRKLAESFWDNIYQAEQSSIGRTVVLHVLRRSLRENPERAQEFLDSASANANIRHAAILPVYEAGEHGGTYFYAREFVVGRTLHEIMASGETIPESTALRVVRAVAEAFAYLEEYGVLHAPLRRSCIFIMPNGEAKLADLAVGNPAAAQRSPARDEIQLLGRMLIPLTRTTALPGSGRVLSLIEQMESSRPIAITSWGALAAETKKLGSLIGLPAPVSRKKTGVLEKVKLWGKRG
jgi:hypothetical protein